MMLLDEPTAGMAHEDVERITALIKRVAANRTVLMVEHNLSRGVDALRPHHRAARGEILAEGDYASVSKNPHVVEAYLGLPRRMPDRCSRARPATPGTANRTSCTASTSMCAEGEVVTLLGRNGAGKTTTLKSIMGMVGSAHGLDPLQGHRD